MRADAALEHGIAVEQQVMRGDGRSDAARAPPSTNAAASLVVMCSSTIFSARKALDAAGELALDEHRLAVEHVDCRDR